MAVPAHMKYMLLTVLFVLASFNFTRTALEIIENSKRLDSLSQEVEEMKEDKRNYENEVAFKKTDEYIEEKARNDLNLIKPGEKVYVVSGDMQKVDLESQVLGQKAVSQKLFLGKLDGESNLVRWWRLFTK